MSCSPYTPHLRGSPLRRILPACLILFGCAPDLPDRPAEAAQPLDLTLENIDAAAAGEFLRTQDYTNGKVGIYGYSYEGITSMAAIARVPGVFDAAVPMAGIYDFGDA